MVEASRMGDANTFIEAVIDIVASGQATRVMSMIKRLSPRGGKVYLQRVVERLNNVEYAGRIADGKMQAVTLTKESLRSWRYLCMLGNARTHVRNILGNFTMPAMRWGKDTTGTVLESYSTWIQQNEFMHPTQILS